MRQLKQKDIQQWFKYTPIESHYSRYTPATISSAYKIIDVYQMFTMARWNNGFYLENDYGHLCNKNDSTSMTYVRNMFILNSLSYYNNSIDLTWQTIWYYYNTDTYDLIYDEKTYNDISSNCDYDNLIKLLKYRSNHHSIEGEKAKQVLQLVKDFFSDELTMKIRSKYNYLKHRGNFYVKGLGDNSSHTMFTVNEKHLKLLTRKELKLEETSILLEEFDEFFVDYMNKIIDILMPKDYFKKNLDLNGVINEYFLNQNKL